jgi:hypothetical protein
MIPVCSNADKNLSTLCETNHFYVHLMISEAGFGQH